MLFLLNGVGFSAAAVALFSSMTAPALVSANPVPVRARGCATTISDELKEAFEGNFRAFKSQHRGVYRAIPPVDTFFHVVMKDGTVEGGNITYVLESLIASF